MFETKFNKALVLLLVLYFFSTIIFSQTVYSNKPSSAFFFTLGLTSSNLIKDSVDYKSGISFNGGFIYNVSLSDKINIATEFLYTGKGFKQDSPNVKYRYFYMDIPLYFQLKMSPGFRAIIGAQYSKFTNSQMVNIDGSKQNGVNTEKFNNIKDQDYGFLIGAEINLTENLSMAARYTLSTSTFFEKNKINFGVFQLSFNYVAFRTYQQFFHKKEVPAN